jgi:hypothetical protein
MREMSHRTKATDPRHPAIQNAGPFKSNMLLLNLRHPVVKHQPDPAPLLKLSRLWSRLRRGRNLQIKITPTRRLFQSKLHRGVLPKPPQPSHQPSRRHPSAIYLVQRPIQWLLQGQLPKQRRLKPPDLQLVARWLHSTLDGYRHADRTGNPWRLLWQRPMLKADLPNQRASSTLFPHRFSRIRCSPPIWILQVHKTSPQGSILRRGRSLQRATSDRILSRALARGYLGDRALSLGAVVSQVLQNKRLANVILLRA